MFKRIAIALATVAALTSTAQAISADQTYDISSWSREDKLTFYATDSLYTDTCADGPNERRLMTRLRILLEFKERNDEGATITRLDEERARLANDSSKWCNDAYAFISKIEHANDPVNRHLPNYEDRSYTCDAAKLSSHLVNITKSGRFHTFGDRFLYIKGEPREDAASNHNALVCADVTIVTSLGTETGTFKFFNQDGHALVSWKAHGKLEVTALNGDLN